MSENNNKTKNTQSGRGHSSKAASQATARFNEQHRALKENHYSYRNEGTNANPVRYSESYRSGAARVAKGKAGNQVNIYNAESAAKRIAEKYGTINKAENGEENKAKESGTYAEVPSSEGIKDSRANYKVNAARAAKAARAARAAKEARAARAAKEARAAGNVSETKNVKPEAASVKPASNTNNQANNTRTNNNKTKKGKSRPEKKKKKIWPRVVLVIIAILAVLAVIILINVGSVKSQASNLKDELSTAMTCIQTEDMDGLDNTVTEINKTLDSIETSVNGPLWTVMSKLPVVGSDVQSVRELIGVMGELADQVLNPLVAVVKENPISELKVGDGYNVKIIRNYIDFVKTLVPEIQTLSEEISNIHLSVLAGAMENYTSKIQKITDIYGSMEEYIPLIEAILNVDEDRTYILAAQNSAEIRAAGGFPGSVGLITIRDGILTIGDFQNVYSVFESDTPGGLYGVNSQEIKIFTEQYSAWAHDATYNPDFERVGEIWCHNYEEKNGEKIDGVISLTPVVIQRLLESTGKSITMTDGTVLDGTNATKVLQHDIYWKYFSDESTLDENNILTDEMFADTVKQVMSLLTEDISVDTFTGLFDVMIQGAEDRTVLMYMADEDEQQYVKNCGFDGRMNDDEDNPKAGIYFGFTDPSKMGWYVDIDREITGTETLDDGTIQYSIQVTLRNNITSEETNTTSWLVGSYQGSIMYNLELTAPAGGDFSDFETDPYLCLYETKYRGVKMAYATEVFMDPGQSLTIKYKVTTAKGVETPLKFDVTPTLQEFRD